MKPIFPSAPVLFLLAISQVPANAQDVAIWHRDFASGRAEAVEEGKKLLVVFTGTDWIEICTKFHDEILSQPSFIDAVSKRFALVKLEFPKDNALPRGEALQKSILRDAYRVRGFPTVILADTEGRPFGINGFQPAGPVEYAAQLLEIEAVHEEAAGHFAKAATMEGLEKARSLARGLPDLPGGLLVRFYQPQMEAILAADPDDTLKLRSTFQPLLAESAYAFDMLNLRKAGDWAAMLARTNRHIGENGLKGRALQAALLNRSGIERQLGDGAAVEKSLREAVAIDPESDLGKEAARQLEGSGSSVATPPAELVE